MEDFAYIHITREDRIAILTIDRPRANSLSRQALVELDAAFAQVAADPQVKVIIITGAGSLFSAGADIAEIGEFMGYADAKAMAEHGQAVLNRIESASKPVIAAINGRFALGGGNELAMACHLRIAEEGARLGQTEIRLGLIPGWGGTQRLPRLVGEGRALELMLTGEQVDATEAHRIGLVNRVVPAGQALVAARALAQVIAQWSAPALAAILESTRRGRDVTVAEGLSGEAEAFARICETEDKREGISAFLQKRSPRFQDR